MRLSHDEVAEDVLFIFEECKRIRDMGNEVFRLLPTNEALFDLPHPSGSGSMLCGREAALRIEKLAQEAGRRSGISRRVEFERLIRITKELLVQRFFVERRELGQKQVDRFFSSIDRQARADCSNLTHFIPCTLMTEQEPDTLTVGPVTFRNRANFRSRVRPLVSEYKRDFIGKDNHDLHSHLMSSSVHFFRQFDWVAEVSINGCDQRTSRRIAERAVTSALDCLHLIFRAKHTNKMRVGGPALRTDTRASLTINTNGKLIPGKSRAWAGQGNFPEGWSKQLDDPGLKLMLSLSGVALEAAVDPDLARPLSRRFLDAAQWFGEASRDDRPATRVVKYVTALERMVMTDEKDDIASTVAERVAALCCNAEATDRQQWRDDVSEIYDLRSRLVHGSMSPSDPTIENGAWLAARIGESAIRHAIGSLGFAGLKEEKVSTKRLATWFSDLILYVGGYGEGSGFETLKLTPNP